MADRPNNDIRFKPAVSVTQMCVTLQLSRARFYELVKRGVFHPPVYSLATRRPFYLLEQQKDNVAVKETNIGVNGEFILFYQPRDKQTASTVRSPTEKTRPPSLQHPGLLEGLRSLGLTPTQEQVAAAVVESFPRGTEGVDESEILRAVYRTLRLSGGR